MILAIASGKGGTGKTTVAVNLAVSAKDAVRLLDCDVEEPNCRIFLNAASAQSEVVSVYVPVIAESGCTGCGDCSSFCEFNALAVTGKRVLIFPELCHGCGGCALVCPRKIIRAGTRPIGALFVQRYQSVELITGRLNIGEAMAPPLIRAVKEHMAPNGLTIIDSPPGTSCSMIAAVKGSDFVLLVTEPTPFGLHDLQLAVETVRKLGLPFAVVVNRSNSGDASVNDYCETEQIPIFLEIPDERRIAETYSRGRLIVDDMPEYRHSFETLMALVKNAVQNKKIEGVQLAHG